MYRGPFCRTCFILETKKNNYLTTLGFRLKKSRTFSERSRQGGQNCILSFQRNKLKRTDFLEGKIYPVVFVYCTKTIGFLAIKLQEVQIPDFRGIFLKHSQSFWQICLNLSLGVEKNKFSRIVFLWTKESFNYFRTLNDLVWNFGRISWQQCRRCRLSRWKMYRHFVLFENKNSCPFIFGSCANVFAFFANFFHEGWKYCIIRVQRTNL